MSEQTSTRTVVVRAEGVDLIVGYTVHVSGEWEQDYISLPDSDTDLYEIVSEGVRNTCECAINRDIEDHPKI